MSNVNKIKVDDIVVRLYSNYEGVIKGQLYKVVKLYGRHNQDCDVIRYTNTIKRGTASDYFETIKDEVLIASLRKHEYVEGISFNKTHVKIHGNLYHIKNDWTKIMDILGRLSLENTDF